MFLMSEKIETHKNMGVVHGHPGVPMVPPTIGFTSRSLTPRLIFALCIKNKKREYESY